MRAALLLLVGLFWGASARAEGDPVAGQGVYKRNCLACHGARADGKGPAAVAMKPAPTDFTAESWWAGRSDESVKAAVRTGKPGTTMMGFAQLSDKELEDLVVWLRAQSKAAATPP
jgi:high-affinity iron transporter